MDLSRSSQVSPRTVWTVGLHALAIAALGLVLYRLRPMLALLAVSLMMVLALEPLVGLFERWGLKRGWSVMLSLISLLGLFTLIALSVVPMLVDQVSHLVEALPGFVTQVRDSAWLRSLDERFSVLESLERELPRVSGTIAGPVIGVLSSSLGVLVTGITVLTLTVFGLLAGEQLFEQGILWIRPDRRPELRELLLDMNRAVSGYLVGVFLICALGAVVTGTVTWALGVPYFLALGLMYLVLGFIPYIGSLLVALTVSLTTLATVGFRRALIALALFLIYQQIEGNVLQPLIQRRTLKMNPLLIAIVVIAGALGMGVLGAVLALPLAAALQVLLQRVQEQRNRQWARELPAPAPAPAAPPPSDDTEEPLHH
ncbi:AI-2E family transporter [Hyalangium sp.]|uniref:AI-2E family transporter n=1 Tax=Hyalangium sp. TaxID=2028555 RepID=UPI002D713CEC|nr:AI-2E family transporter [Hyalangium sp.]HYI03038.1 AI-2E family transporter [Hyalangium sp.]